MALVVSVCLFGLANASMATSAKMADRPAASTSTTAQIGALYAWGDDDAGQLGVGTIADPADHFDTDAAVPEWTHMPVGTETMAAAAGQSHSLIVTTDGAVYATGYNMAGQLGDGTTTPTTSPVPVAMPNGVLVSAVAAGYKQSMALSTEGAVYTWGKNDYGQNGNGTLTNVVTPYDVPLPGGAVATAISAGANHDLAVMSNGAVYDWGLNSTGQLGDGGTTNSEVPVLAQLPAGVTAVAVAGSASHSLALTSGGTVYAWGGNSYGQLGDGTTIESNTPVPVDLPDGVTVTAISAGDGTDNGLEGGYSLALTSTGEIYAWGDNDSGNLGDGTTTDSDVPVLVQLPAGIIPVSMTAAGNRCHLLTSGGAIYDWGSNEKVGHDVHLVPVADTLPVGMNPVAIADGPSAEQYLTIMRGSALWLTKTSASTYSAAGQTLTYSYGVTDTGTTPLSAVSVADDKVAAANLNCPTSSLVPSESETCTGTYVTTEADVSAGSVTNTANAGGTRQNNKMIMSNTAICKVEESDPG